MTILKTYARLWTDDLDHALPLLEQLTGEQPHLRMTFEAISLGAIGDFLVIAGPAEERAKYAHASATVVVEDLDALRTALESADATITTPPTDGPTGRFLYARHADGAGVEYVEWNAELVRRIIHAEALK
ncbi:VOC family protein [Streptomyces sp. NPDC127117]|uniref:VOC family protein n=1 Tax=Streptomyces sp. NPDC127117 TaxID=3345368 RepID=UPI003624C784